MKAPGVIVNVLRKNIDGIECLYLKRSAGSFQGEWWPVAGSCKEFESSVDTALRELEEETGLKPEKLYALGIDHYQFHSGPKLTAFVAFVSPVDKVYLNEEHSDYCWLSIADVYQVVPESVHRIIHYIETEFINRKTNQLDLLK